MSILSKITSAFNALAPLIKILIVVVVLAFGWSYVKDVKDTTPLESYISQYDSYLNGVKTTLKTVDSVQTIVVKLDTATQKAKVAAGVFHVKAAQIIAKTPSKDSLAKLSRAIDSLKKATNDSVILARTVIPAQDALIRLDSVTIKDKDSTIVLKNGEIVQLHVAIASDSSSLQFKDVQVKSLEDKLDSIPKAPKDDGKILGITLPSRKTSFLAGIGTGIIVILLLVVK